MEYTVKIFPDPEGDGDYIAEIEELKGCSAFGETPEEALREVEIAMQLWIEPTNRFNVIFPESLLSNVDEYRGKYGMKRSELLAAAAEQFISTRRSHSSH
jgi:antitoxin HicB